MKNNCTRNNDAVVKHRNVAHGLGKAHQLTRLPGSQITQPNTDQTTANQDGADDVREF
jgi:hypothetical protein